MIRTIDHPAIVADIPAIDTNVSEARGIIAFPYYIAFNAAFLTRDY